MKTLHIEFEDKEYDALLEAKKDKTWREFLLSLTKKGDDNSNAHNPE